MSVLRFLNFVNLPTTLAISPARKSNFSGDLTRAYSLASWYVCRLYDDKNTKLEIGSELLQCQGCLHIQPVRHAWFTKGLRGPKTPPTKPLPAFFDESGDLTRDLPEIDPLSPRLGYENCEELKDADELTRRVFSLMYGSRADRKKFLTEELLNLVRQNPNDHVSQGAKIARLTVKIRIQLHYCSKFRKDSMARDRLNSNILTRNKLLKELEECDRRKFLHVCEVLGVKHNPVPRKETFIPNRPRPQALHKATTEAEAIRKQKLQDLERKLEQQKDEFYKQKEEIITQIQADLQAMGVDGRELLSEVLEKERKQERWVNSKWYRFLQRFPPAQTKYVTMKVQQ